MMETARISFVSRSYTIAFSMRSGSNEICNLLTRNGLGAPGEIFATFMLNPNDRRSDSAFDALRNVVSARTCGGIFGSKLSHDQRARVDSLLRLEFSNYTEISDLLPNHKWIWLIRRDKIAQAISLCRAETSGVWARSTSDATSRGHGSFDFYYILSRAMMLSMSDLAWKTYFETHGINPYMLHYEDFFGNIELQLSNLVKYLGGLPASLDSARNLEQTLSLSVQRDALSQEWYREFVSTINRVGDIGMLSDSNICRQRWEDFFFNCGWRGDQSNQETIKYAG